jgi:hypothetical protein
MWGLCNRKRWRKAGGIRTSRLSAGENSPCVRWSYYPAALRIQELDAHGETRQLGLWLTIGDPRRRSKRAGKRCNRQTIVDFPAPSAENSRSARAYVFGERGLGSRERSVSADLDAHFHRNARLASKRIESFRNSYSKRHLRCDPQILKTGCDVPETKLLFTAALHAIKSAVGGPQELFDCRSIGRINGESDAN